MAEQWNPFRVSPGLMSYEDMWRWAPQARTPGVGGLLQNQLDPDIVKRGMMLPWGRTRQGEMEFAVPEVLLSLARSARLPGRVAQGYPWTPEDVTEMALNVAGTGYTGALALGRPPPGLLSSGGWYSRIAPDTLPLTGQQRRAMATVDSSVHGNTLIIHKIETPPNMRGTGKAEQALNDILRQADEQGLAVALTPTKAFGASKGRLEKWYRRHGFVPNKGRNKDFSTKESMIRPQPQDLKGGGETVGLLKKPVNWVSDEAERVAERLRKAGMENVTIDHSGSSFGLSSYIKAQTPRGSRHEFRVSDHGVGQSRLRDLEASISATPERGFAGQTHKEMIQRSNRQIDAFLKRAKEKNLFEK